MFEKRLIKPYWLILLFSAVLLLLQSRFRIFRVCEESMAPTLQPGQSIVVSKAAVFPSGSGGVKAEKGAIYVFHSPDDNRNVIKRCILTEGDPIIIDHGWLIADGDRYFLREEQWEMLRNYSHVPEGMFFAVGDNQFHSLDSREFGFIREDRIVGSLLIPRENFR